MLRDNLSVISDTHFFDNGIYKYSKKRQEFSENRKALDTCMFNSLLKTEKDSEILLLGDLNKTDKTQVESELQNISSYRNLSFLPGNHDKYSLTFYKSIFNNVYTGINNFTKTKIDIKNPSPFLNCIIQDIDGKRILFSHYPVFDNCKYDKEKPFYGAIENLREIFSKMKCDLNVHGHTHEKNLVSKSYNVSVENIGFAPKIMKFIIKESFKDS